MLPLISRARSSEWVVGCNLSRAFAFSICFYAPKPRFKFPRIKQSINLEVNLCTCRKVWGGIINASSVWSAISSARQAQMNTEGGFSKWPTKCKIYIWITLNTMQTLSLKTRVRHKIYVDVTSVTTKGRCGALWDLEAGNVEYVLCACLWLIVFCFLFCLLW